MGMSHSEQPAKNGWIDFHLAEYQRIKMYAYQQDDSFKDEFWIYAHVQELKA